MLQTLRFPMLPQLKRNFSAQMQAYVPRHKPVALKDIELLTQFIENHCRILVITGAGISTESGIPDYRSEGVGLYARSNHKPIQYQTFVKSSFARQRYWARNYVGWPRFSECQPNTVHFACREMETNNKTTSIITQNVDHLHLKAGSIQLIELHGSSYRVVCLGCAKQLTRHKFQEMLTYLNPNMTEAPSMIRPDGDVEIPEDTIETFRVPQCDACGGVYKPDVVFFGDNVPKARVHQVQDCVAGSDSVLVLGSTLTVFSSFRIVLQANALNLPVAIVNIGATRADGYATLKIGAKCGDILPQTLKYLFST